MRSAEVDTGRGIVAYVETGDGPPALFVHGVLVSGRLWQPAMAALSAHRRCIAVDLPGHGSSPVEPQQDLSLGGIADTLLALCDSLGLDQVDLVGNDSGGAVAQLLATRAPVRLRSLTLTNCDTHQNLPPSDFAPVVELARKGELAPLLQQVALDPDVARSPAGLGVGYEHPEALSDETIEGLVGAFRSLSRCRDAERVLASVAPDELTAIEPMLRTLAVPTLIVWGTGDHFFDVGWARWLTRTIPGADRLVEVAGAKLFFPHERPGELIEPLVAHWTEALGREPAATGRAEPS